MNQHKPIFVAHRGWSSVFPENTLPALIAAWQAGADEIEFDVQLAKGGVPVLCHDDTTDRTSSLAGLTAEQSLLHLRQADIRLPGGGVAHNLGFTMFEDVLTFFGGRIGMNIHVKSGVDATPVLERMQYCDLFDDPNHCVYIAGDGPVLETAIRLAPAIPRCCLAESTDPDRLLQNAQEYRCRRLQFRRNRYTQGHVHTALDRGLIPNLYYADDPVEAAAAIEQGIVGLLTNDVGLLLARLRPQT